VTWAAILAAQLTNEIKESDLSAGRTLRDVHGNLVRVEQHLLRPDNQSTQLLNLTKRSDYTYTDRAGWGFAVPSGSRLDVMDVTIKMNMPLPEQISEWPGYMSDKGDTMHPQEVKVSMSNQSDTIEMSGTWRLQGDLDEKGKTLSEDRLVFNSFINGWKVDPTYDAGQDPAALFPDGENIDGHDKDELWGRGISPQIKIVKEGNPDRFIRMYTEAYVINNDGKMLNLNDFTSTSENPFTVLKQVAGEQIIFCRNLDGTDFLMRGNLDLVYTPDLVISVAEKLATELGDLTKESSSSDSSSAQ
jgi:hypothetical protein